MLRRAPLLLVLLALFALVPAAGATTTEQTLKRLGGKPCNATSAFTCVTITVPLDHANPTNGQTMRVAFAVRPGKKRTKGLLVVATGGPGSAGIAFADAYLQSFPVAVLDRFDIVFFDQRGVGRSGGLACPKAVLADAGPNATVQQQTQAYVDACIRELKSTRLLPWIGTDQAVEDLEAFRVALGSPNVWLYGESYGTQYGQIYAAKHPDATRGLIIDGVVDLTLSAPDFWTSAAKSFERDLNAVLLICADRPVCSRNAEGDPAGAFDDLRNRLATGPIKVRYPLTKRRTVTRALTADLLDAAVSGSLYGTYGRMLLQRAIASAARGDLKPILELGYLNSGVDIATNKPIPDPSFSQAVYFGVDCRDYSWYSGTQEERNAAFLAQAALVEAELPRIGGSQFRSDYACIWWPAAAPDVPRPAPLVNAGIPTFVLNADYDPITPVGQARAVASRLADGYLIVQRGGPHVIFGRGERCIDDPVNAFLISGRKPTKRQITCPGVVVQPYQGLGPKAARGFATVADAMRSFKTQADYAVPAWYWDGAGTLAMPCTAGGTLTATTTRSGDLAYRYAACSFTPGLAVTGTATTTADGSLVQTIRLSGRFSGAYRVTQDGTRVAVTPLG